eukprot:TRINITY_DN6236_c0_g1_i13.p1 TRINITY_DN6236_c0_g1~~TRINITY_DN6236_c0_g1_i13.p1  ORF type:complete len:158 (+),score=36.60 TRINITY_DN6236_c0_g1_i13:216-689(+)
MKLAHVLLLLCLAFLCRAKNAGCNFCTHLVEFIKKRLKGETYLNKTREAYFKMCQGVTIKEYCEAVDHLFIAPGYPIAVSTVDTEKICTLAGFCDNAVYVKDDIEVRKKLVLGKTRKVPARAKDNTPSKKPIRFLVVGDTHIAVSYTHLTLPTICSV